MGDGSDGECGRSKERRRRWVREKDRCARRVWQVDGEVSERMVREQDRGARRVWQVDGAGKAGCRKGLLA